MPSHSQHDASSGIPFLDFRSVSCIFVPLTCMHVACYPVVSLSHPHTSDKCEEMHDVSEIWSSDRPGQRSVLGRVRFVSFCFPSDNNLTGHSSKKVPLEGTITSTSSTQCTITMFTESAYVIEQVEQASARVHYAV